MPCGWEGIRSLAWHWPCVTDFQWFIHVRARGLRKGDEHPAYALLVEYGPFSLPYR